MSSGNSNQGQGSSGSGGSSNNTGYTERYRSPAPAPVPPIVQCPRCNAWNGVGQTHPCQPQEAYKFHR